MLQHVRITSLMMCRYINHRHRHTFFCFLHFFCHFQFHPKMPAHPVQEFPVAHAVKPCASSSQRTGVLRLLWHTATANAHCVTACCYCTARQTTIGDLMEKRCRRWSCRGNRTVAVHFNITRQDRNWLSHRQNSKKGVRQKKNSREQREGKISLQLHRLRGQPAIYKSVLRNTHLILEKYEALDNRTAT